MTFASKFTKFEPSAAYLQYPRAARAETPYVNMFRVVNKDDVVPKVSMPAIFNIDSTLSSHRDGSHKWVGSPHVFSDVVLSSPGISAWRTRKALLGANCLHGCQRVYCEFNAYPDVMW